MDRHDQVRAGVLGVLGERRHALRVVRLRQARGGELEVDLGPEPGHRRQDVHVLQGVERLLGCIRASVEPPRPWSGRTLPHRGVEQRQGLSSVGGGAERARASRSASAASYRTSSGILAASTPTPTMHGDPARHDRERHARERRHDPGLEVAPATARLRRRSGSRPPAGRASRRASSSSAPRRGRCRSPCRRRRRSRGTAASPRPSWTARTRRSPRPSTRRRS